MNRAEDLRHLAALYRRVAGVHTTGGHNADRELLALAERLEDEAARLESENEPISDAAG
jgi:hypothetical protein